MDAKRSTGVTRKTVHATVKPDVSGASDGAAEPAPGRRSSSRLRFTVKVLDALEPQPRRYLVHDAGDRAARGLCLAVEPTGRKTFYWYRRVDGRPERLRIGEFPATSVECARGTASAYNQAHAVGENPAAARRSIRAEMTLGDLFKRYLELHARPAKKQSSVTADEWLWKRYLSPWGADRKLSSVRVEDVAALLAEIAEKRGKHAANSAHSLLRHMLNKAMEWGWSPPGGNPAARLKRFKTRSRERYLGHDEMRRLLVALRATPDTTIRDVVLLALLTGARRSNLTGMAWSELDIDGGTWHCQDTKGGPLSLPLVPAAVAILRSRKTAHDALAEAVAQRAAAGATPHNRREAVRWRHDEVIAANGQRWVFPATGVMGHYREPKRAFQALLNRAGITAVRFHDLRRTSGSWSAALGTSLVVLQQQLGHRDVDSTMVYSRIPLDPVRAAMERTAEAMLKCDTQAAPDAVAAAAAGAAVVDFTARART